MSLVAEYAAGSGGRTENGAPRPRRSSIPLITTAQDVDELIESLEGRAPELRPHAVNANQILCPELMTFLTSERGQEFAESLRFETFERLRQATERAQELSDELRAAQSRAQNVGRVFAFVVSATQR